MAGAVVDHSRAPVAYGLRAVPQLFEELQQPATERKKRALNSLCDLVHDPERLYQTVTGGFLGQLKALFEDKDPSVRSKACELLYLLTAHSVGRRALLSSSLLSPLSQLLDDPWVSCRVNVHRVLNRLVLLPAGAEALLRLVPKLMLKLRETEQEPDEERGNEGAQEETGCTEGNEKDVEGEEGDEEVKEKGGSKEPDKKNKENAELKAVQLEPIDDEEEKEEELVLLLSTLSSCSRLDALPALASNGISLLRHKLSHRSKNVRREAAAAMMALSVPVDGKQQVCEQSVLPVLMDLLRDKDLEVRVNAAGVVMNSVIITSGKVQSLKLGLVPVLLDLVSAEDPVDPIDPEVSHRRKALVLYCLRALTSLSEAPKARTLLLEQRHLLEQRRDHSDMDQDLLRATQTALRVINWTP